MRSYVTPNELSIASTSSRLLAARTLLLFFSMSSPTTSAGSPHLQPYTECHHDRSSGASTIVFTESLTRQLHSAYRARRQDRDGPRVTRLAPLTMTTCTFPFFLSSLGTIRLPSSTAHGVQPP